MAKVFIFFPCLCRRLHTQNINFHVHKLSVSLTFPLLLQKIFSLNLFTFAVAFNSFHHILLLAVSYAADGKLFRCCSKEPENSSRFTFRGFKMTKHEKQQWKLEKGKLLQCHIRFHCFLDRCSKENEAKRFVKSKMLSSSKE